MLKIVDPSWKVTLLDYFSFTSKVNSSVSTSRLQSFISFWDEPFLNGKCDTGLVFYIFLSCIERKYLIGFLYFFVLHRKKILARFFVFFCPLSKENTC